MYIYQKKIQPKNTAAKITAALCLISGGALLILANANLIAIPILAQLLGLSFIIAAVYIATSYLLREYTYSLQANNRDGDDLDITELYDFIVCEGKGKKSVKVCHIELKDVTSVRKITHEDKQNEEQKNEQKNAKRFVYNTQFASSQKIEILASISGENYSVIVTYDEELFSVLEKICNNKSLY
jgi:hypothetical protein